MKIQAIIALALLIFDGGAKLAGAREAAAEHKEFSYGDVVEIAPNARLIGGREINLSTKEVDLANALLYKSGTTLVVIDTGGTPEFVEYLKKAADQLKPFEKVMLITTHGHADHVGNNAWIDTLGVPETHFISAHELAKMRGQVAYFAAAFAEAMPYVPGLPPAAEFARALIDMYGEFRPETKSLTVFESLPLEEITIGGTVWNGYRLLQGNVIVLQTDGHTAGHVAVFLPALKLLHLGDETTGYYQAFRGGSPALNLLTLERSTQAVKEGAVKVLTDGHSFQVHRGHEAAKFVDGFVRGALHFDAAVVRILNENPDGITIGDLVAKVGNAPEMKDARRYQLHPTLQHHASAEQAQGTRGSGAGEARWINPIPTVTRQAAALRRLSRQPLRSLAQATTPAATATG